MAKVDNYFRGKNEESLNFYQWKINEEKRKEKEQQKKIKRYEKHLNKMNKTVETKKYYLNEVETQIYKLKTNLKSLSSCGKRVKKRKTKLTEGSDDESLMEWKNVMKQISNPEDNQKKA